MQFTKKQQVAIDCLRSLCTSKAAALSVQQLLQDYEDMEGQRLDWSGFSSPIEMLKASDEFIFHYDTRFYVTMVTAKCTYKSAHIVEMTNAQRPKKAKNKGRRPVYRAPQASNLWGVNRVQQPRRRPVPAVSARDLRSTNNNVSDVYNRNYTPFKTPNMNYMEQARPSLMTLPSQKAKVVNLTAIASSQQPLKSQCTNVVNQGENERKLPRTRIVNPEALQPDFKVSVMKTSQTAPVASLQTPVQPQNFITPQVNQNGFTFPTRNPASDHSKVSQSDVQVSVIKTLQTASSVPLQPVEISNYTTPQVKQTEFVFSRLNPSFHHSRAVQPDSKVSAIKTFETTPDVSLQMPIQTQKFTTPQVNRTGFTFARPNPSSYQRPRIVYDKDELSELPVYSESEAFTQCCKKTATKAPKQPRPSVQGRINQIKKIVSNEDLEIPSGQIECKKSLSTKESSPENGPESWDNPTLNSIAKLELYCKIKEVPPPDYRYFKIKEGKKFKYQCRVTVDGATYSTYPDDFDTEEQAKIMSIAEAIEQIKEKTNIEKFPLFEGDVNELALKMHECILKHPTGVFLKEVQNIFRAEYSQTLPDKFINILLFSHKDVFRIEQNTINEDIVFAVEDVPLSRVDSLSSILDDLDANALPQHYPKLPWNKDTWKVICTYPESTQQLWCSLLESEYHDKRNDLNKAMELSNINERPPSIDLGQHYIAVVHKYPYRVRAINANPETEQILCFFIDEGNEEWLQEDQLFVCKDAFLQLPAQAVALSLEGLEIFGNLEDISCCLSDLQDGSFIAKIVSTEDEFMNKKSIRVVLYDTSTEDDILVNAVLLNKIKNVLTAPKIEPSKTYDIMVTGISDDGFVTCYNKASPYMSIINQGIRNMVTLVEVMASQRGYYLENDDLYLMYDDVYRHFVRAKLVGLDNEDRNNVIMELVDFGPYRRVDNQKVYRLLPYAAALNIIPPQALKVQLHDIETSDPYVISLFRGLIKSESSCLVRYESEKNGIPQVNLFCRNKNLQKVNWVIKTQLKQMRPVSPDNELENSGSSLLTLESDVDTDLLTKNSCSSLPKPKIPNIGERFGVKVTVSQSPKRFYVQADMYSKDFIQMTSALQRFCENTPKSITTKQLKNGMHFVAKTNNFWCRVKLLSSYDQNRNKVYCCDYGCIDMVETKDMRELTKEFSFLPEQAIPAKLYGIKPYYTHEFSGKAAYLFIQLTRNKQFEAIVKNIESQEESGERVVTLELYERTPFRLEAILISGILISESLALPDTA